jgi:hypothetical protein
MIPADLEADLQRIASEWVRDRQYQWDRTDLLQAMDRAVSLALEKYAARWVMAGSAEREELREKLWHVVSVERQDGCVHLLLMCPPIPMPDAGGQE